MTARTALKTCISMLAAGQSLMIAICQAQDNELDTLFSLPLEDLLSPTIITANRVQERLDKSASLTSVITAKQLEDWGVNSLAEAISMLSGVELYESYFGYTTLNFRGVRQTHYNNKVLLLINGHPSYEPVTGSFHLEQIPLSAIDRIEVIKGPGSPLYGTNAMARHSMGQMPWLESSTS